APAAVPLPGVLDGADPRRAAGGGFAVGVGALLLAAGVRQPGGPRTGAAGGGPGAGGDRAGGGAAGLPGGAAPHGQMAPCPGRCAAGGAAAGSDQGRPWPVPGHLPGLPEAVRCAGFHPDPDAVDLPGLDRDPAGCLAGLLAGRFPLPAGGHAPAGWPRGVCTAAPGRPLPPGPPRGPRPAHRAHAGAGADADRLAAAGVPRQARRHPPAAPRRGGRVAAGARPGRRQPRRAVRGLPPARAGGRSLAALPRRPAGPRRQRHARRPAPAPARCAAAQGRLPVPLFRWRIPVRHSPVLALALLGLLSACERQAPAPADEPASGTPAAASEPAVPDAGSGTSGVVEETAEFPAFAGTAVTGAPYDLAAHRGKWVVVNFWATWCKPCLHEMPELSALHTMR